VEFIAIICKQYNIFIVSLKLVRILQVFDDFLLFIK